MMEISLFGVGAAGNKAAINVLEKGILDNDHVFILNTTLKDIPEKYKNNSNVTKFSTLLGGCGKEPAKGRKAMFDAIKDNTVDISTMITESTKAAVIVTSIEGGTGSGSTPILVKFFEAMDMPVHVFAFVGFQDELRGINNSLKFFRDLGDNVILHTIQNDRFLDYTKSYSKAEEGANEEFARQLKILIGAGMLPSSQNIDDTDHYKILTTPGYMDIKHISLSKLKSQEMVDQAIIDAFDNPSCLDYNSGCKQLAVIVNASQKTQDAIDNSFSVIKRYTGEPFETYRHVQSNPYEPEEYMDVIVTGLAFPESSMVEMNTRYNQKKAQLNQGVKGLSDIFSGMDLDDDDSFDQDVHQVDTKGAKQKFAEFFGEDEFKPKSGKVVTSTKVTKTTFRGSSDDAY